MANVVKDIDFRDAKVPNIRTETTENELYSQKKSKSETVKKLPTLNVHPLDLWNMVFGISFAPSWQATGDPDLRAGSYTVL